MDKLNAVLDDFKDKKLKYGSDMDISKMWIDQVLQAVIDDLKETRNKYKRYSVTFNSFNIKIRELQAAMGRLS